MGVLCQRPPGAPGQGKEGGEDEAEHIVLAAASLGGGAGLMRVLLRWSNCRSDWWTAGPRLHLHIKPGSRVPRQLRRVCYCKQLTQSLVQRGLLVATVRLGGLFSSTC